MHKPSAPLLLALTFALLAAAVPSIAFTARTPSTSTASADPTTSPAASSLALTPDITAEVITYTMGDKSYRGMLYRPARIPAGEKRAGVLVFHEWWGPNDYSMHRARELAKLGYVAFAPDMYGNGRLTTDPEQAGKWATELNSDSFERGVRLSAAYGVLKKRDDVDATRLAAIGYCMGGTMALEAARMTDCIVAVACFHTSTLTAKDPTDTVPLKAEVLVCHGGADTFVKPGMVETFVAAMKDANRPCQLVTYPGALHAFTNSHADAYGLKGVAYDKAADEDSWQQMKALFARTIDKK